MVSARGFGNSVYTGANASALSASVSSLSKVGVSSQVTDAISNLTKSRSSLLSSFNLGSVKTTMSGLNSASIQRAATFGLTAAETLSTDLLAKTTSAMSNNSSEENQASAARMGISDGLGELSSLESVAIAKEGAWTAPDTLLSKVASAATSAASYTYSAISTGLANFTSSAQNFGFSSDTLTSFNSFYTPSTTPLQSSNPDDALGSASMSDLYTYGTVGDSLAMTNLKTQVSDLTSRSIDYSTNTNLYNTTFFDSITKNAGSILSSMSGSAYNTTANGSKLTTILQKAMTGGSVSPTTVASAITAISGSKVSSSTSRMLSNVIAGKTLTAKDIAAVGTIATSLGTSVKDYFKSNSDDVTYTKDGEVIRWNTGATSSVQTEQVHWDAEKLAKVDPRLISAFAPELLGLYGGTELKSEYI